MSKWDIFILKNYHFSISELFKFVRRKVGSSSTPDKYFFLSNYILSVTVKFVFVAVKFALSSPQKIDKVEIFCEFEILCSQTKKDIYLL